MPRDRESEGDTLDYEAHETSAGIGVAPTVAPGETSHRSILQLRCKVIVVGDAKAGKTSLVQMFHSQGREYAKNYMMTLGVDFCVKDVSIPNSNTKVELYIFDAAGQSAFSQRELGSKHWENASVVMAVFDVANRESYQSVAKWLAAVRSVHGGRPVPGVLIANKIDLRNEGRAQVTSEEAQRFAKDNSLSYFECSPLSAVNIDEPFNFIANAYHKKYQEALQRAPSLSGR